MSEDSPKGIRPFVFHGVEFNSTSEGKNGTEYLADCPFCGAANKFSVNSITSQFRCFPCGANGSGETFVEQYHAVCSANTNLDSMKSLLDNRGYLSLETLSQWGVVKSQYLGDWMLPGYNAAGKLRQLYRYANTPDGLRLLPTPGLGHQLHGVNLYKPEAQIVALCEGPWDAMALWECLRYGKWDGNGNGLIPTDDPDKSALNDVSVLAVPGCQTFFEAWLPLFAGKTVWLLYDSDHPRAVCGGCRKGYSSVSESVCPHCQSAEVIRIAEPAGYSAMRRVGHLLLSGKDPAESVEWLEWGPSGFDPEIPSGFDLRDFIRQP